MDGKIYLVPTELKEKDEIHITGKIMGGKLEVALLADKSSSADFVVQLNIVFTAENTETPKTIKTVKNGNVKEHGNGQPAGQLLDKNHDKDFHMKFKLDPKEMAIHVSNTLAGLVELQHNYDDIRAIYVNGHVQQLAFDYS